MRSQPTRRGPLTSSQQRRAPPPQSNDPIRSSHRFLTTNNERAHVPNHRSMIGSCVSEVCIACSQKSPTPIHATQVLAFGSVAPTQATITALATEACSGHWMSQRPCGREHAATPDMKQADRTATGK